MLQFVSLGGTEVTTTVLKYVGIDEWRLSISILEIELSNSVADLVTPALSQEVLVKRGFASVEEDYVFRGQIIQRKPVAEKVVLVCKGEMIEAIKAGRTKSWDKDIDTEAGVGSEIFKSLCDNSTLNYSATSIVSTGTEEVDKIIKFIQNDEDNFQKMNELSEIYSNRVIRFDNSTQFVHFEPPGFTTYTHTLVVGTDIPKQIKWKENMEQMINKVKIFGATVYDKINPSVFAGPATTFTLTKTPEDTEVRQTNAAGALFSRGQKDVGIIGTDFDYYVDVEQKKIIFGASKSNVWVRYGAQIPMPVIVKNQTSIDTYGGPNKKPHFKRYTFNDIKDVADAERRGRAKLAKFSTPFIEAQDIPVKDEVLETHGFIKVGDLVTIQDDFTGETHTAFVKIVEKTYPEPMDKITIGDEIWRTEDWQATQTEQLNLLFNELNKNQDILISIIDIDNSNIYENRYIEKQNKDITGFDGFILGHPTFGKLGTNKLGDDVSKTFTITRIIQSNNIYDEYFYDDDFKLSVLNANWDNGNEQLDISHLPAEVIHFKMNGNSLDSIRSNNGSDTSISYVTGKISQAASFNGSTSLIDVNDHSAIQDIFDGGGSISVWIYPDSDGESSTARIISKADAGATLGWVLYLQSEAASKTKITFTQIFDGTIGTWTSTATEITINAWNHVTLTYDADAVGNNPEIKVNNSVIALTESSTPVGTRISDVSQNITIGNRENATLTFDGEIDDLRLYDSELTDATITALYNVGEGTEEVSEVISSSIHIDQTNILSAKMINTVESGLLTDLLLYMRADETNWELVTDDEDFVFANAGQVLDWKIKNNVPITLAYYKFNGDSSDSSINSNTGADTAISYVTGKLTQAASFDGSSSLVTVSDDLTIQNIFDNGGAISVWIFPDSVGQGGFGRIADKEQWLFYILQEDDGVCNITLFQTMSGNDGFWTSIRREIIIGAWNHVVLNFNNSAGSNASMYVNGLLINTTTTNTTGVRTTDVGDDLIIGNQPGASRAFDGEIDDLRFYNEVLTDIQIASIYNKGSGKEDADVVITNTKIEITEE